MLSEIAVRKRIPTVLILLNNFSMATEFKVMLVSTEHYRSTDISDDYAAMVRAFGAYGVRVTEPAEIIPTIRPSIEQTEQRGPALLKFITSQEVAVSVFRLIRDKRRTSATKWPCRGDSVPPYALSYR